MELTLVNIRFREYKLKRALEPVLRHYDFILLDCPLSLGLLTVNALMAAHHVSSPWPQNTTLCSVYHSFKTVRSIKQEANPDLTILGIIYTHHKRTVHAREVVARTQAELGQQLHIFPTPINDSTRFTEASGMGKTIFDVAPEIEGAKAYRMIAEEIANA